MIKCDDHSLNYDTSNSIDKINKWIFFVRFPVPLCIRAISLTNEERTLQLHFCTVVLWWAWRGHAALGLCRWTQMAQQLQLQWHFQLHFRLQHTHHTRMQVTVLRQLVLSLIACDPQFQGPGQITRLHNPRNGPLGQKPTVCFVFSFVGQNLRFSFGHTVICFPWRTRIQKK